VREGSGEKRSEGCSFLFFATFPPGKGREGKKKRKLAPFPHLSSPIFNWREGGEGKEKKENDWPPHVLSSFLQGGGGEEGGRESGTDL